MRFKLLAFFALTLPFMQLSCNNETPQFYLHEEYDFTLGAGLSTLETHFFVKANIINTFPQEIESLGVSPDQITAVSAGRGLFTPVFHEFDYDVMRDVSIWLVSVKNPSLRKEIYYRDQIPINQNNELRLLSGLADLKDFLLEEESYNLEIQLKFRNFVPSNFENRFTYSFAIFTE